MSANPFKSWWKPQQDLCETCKKRQKFVEKDGTVHPYCSRTCAKSLLPTCKLSGCEEIGKTTFSGYCTPRHARSGVQTGQSTPCYRCKKEPQAARGLCLQCNNIQGDRESSLRELSSSDPKFASVADHVSAKWNGLEKVEVQKVYEVFLPREVYDARERYRKNLEAFGPTHQVQTYRGAQCICDLGVADSNFCTWKSCGICTIIKSSFTAFEFGAKSNPGRYGDGIYSYFDPAKADEFATSSVSSPYRTVISCEVNLPGKSSNALRSPMVAKSSLDEDRVFVSSADAIVPKFVILYTKET